jgi:hypothetical protein
MAHLPSEMSVIGSRLVTAMETFGALPFTSMISTLQSSELRKHSLVRLIDLLPT